MNSYNSYACIIQVAIQLISKGYACTSLICSAHLTCIWQLTSSTSTQYRMNSCTRHGSLSSCCSSQVLLRDANCYATKYAQKWAHLGVASSYPAVKPTVATPNWIQSSRHGDVFRSIFFNEIPRKDLGSAPWRRWRATGGAPNPPTAIGHWPREDFIILHLRVQLSSSVLLCFLFLGHHGTSIWPPKDTLKHDGNMRTTWGQYGDVMALVPLCCLLRKGVACETCMRTMVYHG